MDPISIQLTGCNLLQGHYIHNKHLRCIGEHDLRIAQQAHIEHSLPEVQHTPASISPNPSTPHLTSPPPQVIGVHFHLQCSKALLRRVEMDRGKTSAAEGELRYGDLRYSATENAVFCGSTIVALTQTELRLLSYMMKQPEKAYSREELLSAVWGFDSEVETRVTDETLRRIRKKLLQAGSTVSVSTIWGFGYKLKGAERT